MSGNLGILYEPFAIFIPSLIPFSQAKAQRQRVTTCVAAALVSASRISSATYACFAAAAARGRAAVHPAQGVAGARVARYAAADETPVVGCSPRLVVGASQAIEGFVSWVTQLQLLLYPVLRACAM